MSSNLVNECPSCGGRSLSQTGDGGALVCDDCDEQFQGFRAEEVDEEFAGRMTVFRRTSQSSKIERKRLVAEAHTARISLKLSSTANAEKRDTSRLVYEGVVLLTRAIVDALIADHYAPDYILHVSLQIVLHWVRMCHAGHVKTIPGITLKYFSAHSILAFVSLAAVYVRSSLLPRDLCSLAVQLKIPFLTAAEDLLGQTWLSHPSVRKALCPKTLPLATDLTRLANAFAISEYAWPPLQALFNGDPTIYTHWAYLCFPLGQYEVTALRLSRLLGLPDKFCERVQRYRELRRIATVMHLRAHATEALKKRDLGAKQSSNNEDPDLDGVQPSNLCTWSEWLGLYPNTEPQRNSGYPRQNLNLNHRPHSADELLSDDCSQFPEGTCISQNRSSDDRGVDPSVNDPPQGSRQNCQGQPSLRQLNWELLAEEIMLNSYNLDDQLNALPFTAKTFHKRDLLLEFSTSRTLLVDFISTMRICYGKAASDPQFSRKKKISQHLTPVTTDCAESELDAEWDRSVEKTLKLLSSTTNDCDSLAWTGLSPAAIASIRGQALCDFVAVTGSSLDSSLPLFLSEQSDIFRRVAAQTRQHQGRQEASTDMPNSACRGPCDPDHLSNANSCVGGREAGRFGTWIWDSKAVDENVPDVTTHDGCSGDCISSGKRELLMPYRGYQSHDMKRRKIQRKLMRKRSEFALWEEPRDIDLAVAIIQLFFEGTFANVSGLGGDDQAAALHLQECLDSTMRIVLNYVDIELGCVGNISS